MGAAAGRDNVVMGKVTSQLYVGTQTRYKVKVKQYEFQVATEPLAVHAYAQGDEVGLLFHLSEYGYFRMAPRPRKIERYNLRRI